MTAHTRLYGSEISARVQNLIGSAYKQVTGSAKYCLNSTAARIMPTS
jgi:hypothetical protein